MYSNGFIDNSKAFNTVKHISLVVLLQLLDIDNAVGNKPILESNWSSKM